MDFGMDDDDDDDMVQQCRIDALCRKLRIAFITFVFALSPA